jgi:hypothetical protein
VLPYRRGGTLSMSGETWAIFMGDALLFSFFQTTEDPHALSAP